MDKNYYINRGDKILSSFSLFSDREAKLDKAMDYYKKASTKFIENQDFWNFSLLAEKIGDEYFKINDTIVALEYYTNAQKYYLNLNIDKYLDITINKIIPLHIENNNVKKIGNAYHQLAKLLKGSSEHEKIIGYFQKAISYLETEKSHDLLNCYTDFTYYLLNNGDINCAMHYIELIIEQTTDSALLVYRAIEYIFMYLLCAMTTNDTILVKKKLDEYCELVPRFIDSPSCKLIENLNETYENNDIDKFTDFVYEYNLIYKLKPCEVTLLLKIKKNIKSNSEIDLS